MICNSVHIIQNYIHTQISICLAIATFKYHSIFITTAFWCGAVSLVAGAGKGVALVIATEDVTKYTSFTEETGVLVA